MGRPYFQDHWKLALTNEASKKEIEKDIQKDFDAGLRGIKQRATKNSRFGVYIAYTYYLSLFRKVNVHRQLTEQADSYFRWQKYLLFVWCMIRHKLNLI